MRASSAIVTSHRACSACPRLRRFSIALHGLCEGSYSRYRLAMIRHTSHRTEITLRTRTRRSFVVTSRCSRRWVRIPSVCTRGGSQFAMASLDEAHANGLVVVSAFEMGTAEDSPVETVQQRNLRGRLQARLRVSRHRNRCVAGRQRAEWCLERVHMRRHMLRPFSTGHARLVTQHTSFVRSWTLSVKLCTLRACCARRHWRASTHRQSTFIRLMACGVTHCIRAQICQEHAMSLVSNTKVSSTLTSGRETYTRVDFTAFNFSLYAQSSRLPIMTPSLGLMHTILTASRLIRTLWGAKMRAHRRRGSCRSSRTSNGMRQRA